MLADRIALNLVGASAEPQPGGEQQTLERRASRSLYSGRIGSASSAFSVSSAVGSAITWPRLAQWRVMSARLDFRLFLPQMRFSIDDLVTRAQTAEAAGFTGIALIDHLTPPLADLQPMYEPMTTATWLAARTTTLGIGHLVLCDSMRHPAVMAKEVVSIDHFSHGRFELGIGSGSVAKELATFGVFEGSAGRRIARLGETLHVLKALWAGETVDFDGEFHHLRNAVQRPLPLGHIPIVIGGSGPKTLQLVAQYADWWNVPLNETEKIDGLREHTGSARPSVQQMIAFVPDELRREEITSIANKRFGNFGGGLAVGNSAELCELFEGYAARGIERVYAWFTDFAHPDTITQFGAEVIATFS